MRMIHLSKTFWIVLLIVVIGITVRFYKLGQVPTALNRDEASLGYTAWSILHTGKDEHGVAFPINVQSFGDWKLPLYIYTLIPTIQLLGLNEWSVRLPSAIAGVVAIVLTYLVCKLLLKDTNKQIFTDRSTQAIPLVAALFVALSPWSLHLSRIAYEANLGMALCMAGLLAFLTAVTRSKPSTTTAKTLILLVVSSLFFGLTLFTYHSYQIFTPLFGFLLIALYRMELFHFWRLKRLLVVVPLLVFSVFFGVLILSQKSGANQTKYGGITIFSEKQYEDALFAERQMTQQLPPLLSKLYTSMPRMIGSHVMTNVMKLLNPEFYFLKGGSHSIHNFPNVGNMYWLAMLTVSIGIFVCCKYRQRPFVLLGGWIAAAMVAPLLTIEAAHSTRFSPALIPLEILSAVGLVYLLQWLFIKSRPLWFLSLGLFSAILVYSVYLTLINYFIVFPILGSNNWPQEMKTVATLIGSDRYKNYKIFMQGEQSSPYIWLLFYNPEKYPATNITYYPATDEGFVHARQLNNVTFGPINWSEAATSSAQNLYILRNAQLADTKIDQKKFATIQELAFPGTTDPLIVLERK